MSLLLLLVGASSGGPPPAAVGREEQIRLGVKPTFGVSSQPQIGTMQTT